MATDISQQLLEELTAWKAQFEAGSVKILSLRKPKLGTGEHWAARATFVGTAKVARQDAEAGRPLAGSLGKPDGFGYATNQRLFIVGNNPNNVKYEWRWSDVQEIHMAHLWQGIWLSTDPDSDEVDLVGTDRVKGLAGPKLEIAAHEWLKIEASFAAAHGYLDGWLAALPARLDDMTRGYDLPEQ